MIYITGDTHGEYERFSMRNFPEQKQLTKDDYVIICGDFGIWDDSDSENYNLDQLNNRSFTTLFVDGNHENYDLLKKYPVEEWHGGAVQFIRPSVIHLMRGNVYDIDGRKFFAMGGAASHDIDDGILDPTDPDFKRTKTEMRKKGKYRFRVKGVSWWEDEMPSEEEYKRAWETLEKCGWNVDYIISHAAPTSLVSAMRLGLADFNDLTEFFEEISEKCTFKKWFFGHYHQNLMFGDKYYLIYNKIIGCFDI